MLFVFNITTIPNKDFLKITIRDQNELSGDPLTSQNPDILDQQPLPPMYHKMISWVGLWIDNMGEPRQKLSWSGANELEGLEELRNGLNIYKDFGLIHHKGRSHSLPLIHYLALKYGLQMPARLSHHDIRYRYSKDNLDISEELNNYGASKAPDLLHLAQLIGLPILPKPDVLSLYELDRFQDIEDHNLNSVMTIYLIWLQLGYVKDDLSADQFVNLKKRALQKLEEIQARIREVE